MTDWYSKTLAAAGWPDGYTPTDQELRDELFAAVAERERLVVEEGAANVRWADVRVRCDEAIARCDRLAKCIRDKAMADAMESAGCS